MNKFYIFSIMMLGNIIVFSQNSDSVKTKITNSADNIILNNNKLVVGGYGEIHYNQPFDGTTYNNGKLDVHRMIMFLGYNFNKNTHFVTELEFEHVSEVYVEQAFLQHKLNNYINFRGGLMLVPMGYINEYHEPTAFNGVERPLIDVHICPTTWREIGFGFTGNILPASIKYQVYVMNGFNGYNGNTYLDGKNGLRKARQKGAKSYMSSPNYTGKIEYFGIRGLNIGLSGYFGNTQSTMYDGIKKDDKLAIAKADSSIVGISMIGLDANYSFNGIQLKGQLYYTNISNSEQYNEFTANETGELNDLGKSMIGYYAEIGYNIFNYSNTEKQLIPFVRYEFFDTHNSVEKIVKNLLYQKTGITSGLTLSLTKGAVIKADIHFVKDAVTNNYEKTFNAGIGVMF